MTETLREAWEHLVSHQVTRDIGGWINCFAVDGFDMVGETVRGPFRQAMVYLLRVREGRVVLLRELVDTAALNELFQAGA